MSFLKVKRKSEDDAKEAFILASKKAKLENITQDSPVFELTSIAVQEEEINNLINQTLARRPNIRSRKFDFEEIRNKIRTENRQHAKRNKLKILSYIRRINESIASESIPVIDVNNTTEDENQNQHYVYDLYYSNKCIDMHPDFENNYFIREVDDFCTENAMEDEEDLDEDEDDSNDENNWRNDYPDEDETDDSDDFLSREMKRTYLNSDYSLSSDDYDENIQNDLNSKSSHLKELDCFDYYDKIASDTESDEHNLS